MQRKDRCWLSRTAVPQYIPVYIHNVQGPNPSHPSTLYFNGRALHPALVLCYRPPTLLHSRCYIKCTCAAASTRRSFLVRIRRPSFHVTAHLRHPLQQSRVLPTTLGGLSGEFVHLQCHVRHHQLSISRSHCKHHPPVLAKVYHQLLQQ